MNENLKIKDIGLEIVKWPITKVRVGKVDDRWLVEYRRKPKWLFDGWWWFDDSKYIEYNEAVARAQLLSSRGYITYTKVSAPVFEVTPYDPDDDNTPTPSRSVSNRKSEPSVPPVLASKWENPEDLDGDGDIDEDDYKIYQQSKRWDNDEWDQEDKK